MPDNKLEADEVGTGEETKVERVVSNYLGVAIHLFLSALAVLLLIAAGIAAFDTVVRDFPALISPTADEYVALQKIIENLLLIEIAAEFAFLLLFHRISAAVEVMVFVIARKTVNFDPTTNAKTLQLQGSYLIEKAVFQRSRANLTSQGQFSTKNREFPHLKEFSDYLCDTAQINIFSSDRFIKSRNQQSENGVPFFNSFLRDLSYQILIAEAF